MNKKDKRLLCVAASVVVLTVLIVGLWLLLGRRNGDGAEDGGMTFITPTAEEPESGQGEWQTEGMPEGLSFSSAYERQVLNTQNGSYYELLFPAFRGFGDTTADSEVNALIRDRCYESFRGTAHGLYGMLEAGMKVVYRIEDYRIATVNERLISLVFTGFFDVTSETAFIEAPRTLICYSLNVDAGNRRILESDGLFSDFSVFSDRFCDGKLTLSAGMDGLCERVPYRTMLTEFRADYGIYPDVFFGDGDVSFIIPLTYDMGGYAVFSDPSEEAAGYLDMTIPVLTGWMQQNGGYKWQNR